MRCRTYYELKEKEKRTKFKLDDSEIMYSKYGK